MLSQTTKLAFAFKIRFNCSMKTSKDACFSGLQLHPIFEDGRYRKLNTKTYQFTKLCKSD